MNASSLIKAESHRVSQACYIAVRMTEELDPVVYGVYLDKQQALAAALHAEAHETSDMIRNLSSYGAIQSVIVYPLGEEVDKL